MTLDQKLKQLRRSSGLSQEQLAEQLGVSRQAVAKWECGQSAPSTENLISLSAILQTSLDELVGNTHTSAKKPNLILRTNLTRLAIIAQAAFLYATVQHAWSMEHGLMPSAGGLILFDTALLLLASVWMASNHRFESDLRQRAKNSRIELLYCSAQLGIALLTWHFGMGLVGGGLMVAATLFYILRINPKYMNRKLTK